MSQIGADNDHLHGGEHHAGDRLGIHDPELRTVVAAVVDAEQNLDSARAGLRRHFVALNADLMRTGTRSISIDDARTLYWKFPEIQVSSIGLALGVHAARVYEIVGGSLMLTCDACGIHFSTGRRTSRTGWVGYRNHWCPTCEPVQRDREQAEWKSREIANEERYRVERDARIARIRAGDYWIDDHGEVILPEDFLSDLYYGSCSCHRSPGRRRIADDEAWRSGKGVVYMCVECGESRSPTLVTYTPPQSAA